MQVFEELLLDADYSINAGNWMWLSASAFFHQYTRIFCPVRFGKRTDPQGDYIRSGDTHPTTSLRASQAPLEKEQQELVNWISFKHTHLLNRTHSNGFIEHLGKLRHGEAEGYLLFQMMAEQGLCSFVSTCCDQHYV